MFVLAMNERIGRGAKTKSKVDLRKVTAQNNKRQQAKRTQGKTEEEEERGRAREERKIEENRGRVQREREEGGTGASVIDDERAKTQKNI